MEFPILKPIKLELFAPIFKDPTRIHLLTLYAISARILTKRHQPKEEATRKLERSKFNGINECISRLSSSTRTITTTVLYGSVIISISANCFLFFKPSMCILMFIELCACGFVLFMYFRRWVSNIML